MMFFCESTAGTLALINETVKLTIYITWLVDLIV